MTKTEDDPVKTKQAITKKPAGCPAGLNFAHVCEFVSALFALFKRGTQNIAQGCAGIGGAELLHGFFLFGHFQRLD
jgi:hypothetical protein